MARTPKRVVERNLLKVPVLIEDTVSYSKYFEVSRLNPNFHAGKNGFLIRGTQFLKNGTTIQVEVLDRYGKTVFSNVIGNYSEGDARLVSVEITQKTRKGPGKLVVVGTATNYEDGRPIPSNQQNRPNVRWVFPIDIDASRRNTSKLILQNTPAQILNGLSVTRTDFNTTSRTDAVVTNSTYTASLDYDFEGHRSDGYAITMLDNSGNPTPFFDDVSIDGYFTGSLYKREISNLYDTGVLVPDSQSIVLNYVTASVYTPLFKTLNETLAITEKSIKFGNGDDYLNPILRSGSYSRVVTSDDLGGNLVRKLEEEITSSVIFEYPTETLTTSANNSSILNFRIPYTQTHTGEIAKVRISAKEANPEITAYQLLTEFNPSERNILVTGSNTGNVSIGRFLTDDRLQNYWQSGLVNITDYENSQSANPITLVTSSAEILEGFYADHTESAVPYYFGTQEFYQLYQGVQYTLKYDAVYNPTYVSSSTTYSTTDTGSVKAYLTRIGSDAASKASSSVVIATKNGVENTYGLLVDEVNTRDNDKGLYERQVNFTPERDGVAYLRYIVDSGFWNFSNFVITPAVEYGYNPDEIVVYAEDTILTGTTYIFKIEFIGWAGDISDEFISDPIELPPKGGGSSIRLISDRQVFSFGSDGTPTPAQQTASVDVVLTNITSTPQFTLVDDDSVPVQTQFYSASNGNLNIELYHTAFGEQTASLNPDPTGSILLTVSASAGGEIITDKLRFNRVKDATDGTPGEQGPSGSAGTDAKTVKLALSDYSIVYSAGATDPNPPSITASAQQQNLVAPVTYSFFRTGSLATTYEFASVPVAPVTYSFVAPPVDDYDSQLIRVEVTESATGIAFDTDDFFGVTPGKDGWTAILINEAHTIPAQSDGTPLDFGGSGADIEIIYGGTNLLPWTGSAPPDGYFSASVITSQSVNQPQKTGSIAELNGEQTYVRFGDIDFMEPTAKTGSITYEVSAYTSSYSSDYRKFILKQSFSKTNDGTDGVDGGRRFYIEPQNGRSFKTDGNGVTVPTNLFFITKLSEGDTVSSLPSSSDYQLFFSSSGDAVPGAPSSANYSASAADITGHDVLEFYSASVLVDTIDITDVTDGLDSLIPLLEVKGPIAWLSGSSGIDPDTPSQITASLYKTGSEAEYLYAAVDAFDRVTETAPYGLTGSVIVSSSNNVSGSFTNEYVSAGGDVFNLGFSFFATSSLFSDPGDYKQVAQETFVLTLDGKDGETGATGSNARSVRLNVSDYSIVYSEFGKDPNPTTIEATASVQNIVSQSAYFAWFTGSTDVELQTVVAEGIGQFTQSFGMPNDVFNPKLIRVKVSESLDTDYEVEDSVNVYGVVAGENAFTIILTNEAHPIPAAADGTVSTEDLADAGTGIEVLYGGTNLTPTTASGTPDIGEFSASVSQSSGVTPDSAATINGVYLEYPPPTVMAQSANSGSITYKITAVTGSALNPEIYTFVKKQSFSKTRRGVDGENAYVYYITPLDGLQFKTNAQGTTTPNRLIFQTQRSSGSIIEDVPSGSFDGEQFGLFFSGSNLPLSGSGPNDPGGPSSYYTASADDIFQRAVIRYLTGSGAIGSRYIVDSVSVEDLTDGQDGITPILEVSGAITFNSSSVGISPTGPSSITGSLIRASTTLATISSSITPSSTTGFTVNAVGSSSLSVSSSWQLTADKDGTPIGYNFKFFSGSIGSYTQVGAQPFNINIDGAPGQDAPIINLVLDGPVTFVSSSLGISPTATTSKITGSLIENGTTYLASGSISASIENGFQTFTIGSGSSVISASWNSLDSDNTAYEFRFFSGSAGNYTQVKVQPYVIGKFGSDGQNGSNGTDSKVVSLTANRYTIPYDADGVEIGTNQIQLTASQQNHQGTIYYGFKSSSDGGATFSPYADVDNTSQYFLVPEADEPGPNEVLLFQVDTTESLSGAPTDDPYNPIIAFDNIDVFGIQEGAGYTVFLTNEAHTFDATSDGTVSNEDALLGSTTASFFKGTTRYEYDQNTPYELDSYRTGSKTIVGIKTSPTIGLTTTTPTVGGKTQVAIRPTLGSDIEDPSGYVDIPLIDNETGLEIIKRYSFSKSKAGSNAPIINLILDGTTTFSSGSGGVVPSTPSDITGSLVQNGTTYLASGSITPSNTAGFNATTIGSGSISVSASWNGQGSDNLTYEFRFFSGSTGNYTQVAAQSYVIDRDPLDGEDGAQGSSGPGLIYVGEYNNIQSTWAFSNDGVRRDVILSGSQYFYYSGSDGTTKSSITAANGDPYDPNETTYWGQFTQFTAVATDMLLAKDIFTHRTINVGVTGSLGGADISPAITLNADYANNGNNPYISIGQAGNQDYAEQGIFIGSGSTAPKLSLSGSSGHLLWDGSTLNILGDISASSGFFSGSLYANDGNFDGTVLVGDDTVVIGQGTSPKSVSKVGFSNTPIDNKYDSNTSTNTFTVTEQTAATLVHGTDGNWVNGDSIEIHFRFFDIELSPPAYFVDEITDISFKIIQNGITTDIGPISESYQSNVNNFFNYTASYVANSETNIQVKYSAVVNLDANGPGTATSYYTSSVDGNYLTPSIAVSNRGIFFNRGNGEESILNLGLVGGGGSGGGGGANVNISGTPLNDQVTVWTNSNTIEGSPGLLFDGSILKVTGSSAALYVSSSAASIVLDTAGSTFLQVDGYISASGNGYFDGNVGIGTASPSAKLDVVGDTFLTGSLDIWDGVSGATIQIYSDGSGQSRMIFGASGQIVGAGGDFNIQGQNKDIQLSTDNGSNTLVHLDHTDQRVGIGTTNPGGNFVSYRNDTTTDSTTITNIVAEQDGTGDASIDLLLTGTRRWRMAIDNSDGDKYKISTDASTSTNAVFTIDTSGNVGIGTTSPSSFKLQVSGDVGPNADATHDLGSSSLRWANIYTADFHLSNESSSPNSVDGTHGNWTIQEGEEYLYIINNKSGKKYRFMLEEIE